MAQSCDFSGIAVERYGQAGKWATMSSNCVLGKKKHQSWYCNINYRYGWLLNNAGLDCKSPLIYEYLGLSVQFSSVAQSCPTLCHPMNHSTPGLPVHHQLPEFTQTHVHWVGDAIQSSHPLSSPSPPAPNPSQHQSLFQWVSSSQEVAKVLEFQL